MVNAWLLMKDDVFVRSGEPTWNSLVSALKKIGHTGVAMAITKEAQRENTSGSSSGAKIARSVGAAKLLKSSVQADGASCSGDIIRHLQDHSSEQCVPSTQGKSTFSMHLPIYSLVGSIH